MKDEVTKAVLDLTEREDGLLCQVWYPDLWRVKKGEGEGTIKFLPSNEETGAGLWNPEGGSSGETVEMVPRNPVLLAVCSATEGGLYGYETMADNGGVCEKGISKVLERWMEAHVKSTAVDRTLEESRGTRSVAGASRGSEFSLAGMSAAKELAKEASLVSLLRDKLTRRASEMKRAFIRRFMKSAFPHGQRSDSGRGAREGSRAGSSAPNATVSGVEPTGMTSPDPAARLLGGGSVDTSSLCDDVYPEWKASRKSERFLFGAWRRLSSDEMQQILDEKMPEMKVEVAGDQWESRDTPRGFVASDGALCGDKLFVNGHASRAMATWMGRLLVDGEIDGDTSVLSIARADAWVATHFSLSTVPLFAVSDSGNGSNARQQNLSFGGGGLRNTRHNELFSILLPHALVSLLEEIREAMVAQCGPQELHKPFSVTRALELRREVHKERSSQIGTTEASQSSLGDVSGRDLRSEMSNEVVRRLDSESTIPYATHGGDVFTSAFRVATISFRYHPTEHCRGTLTDCRAGGQKDTDYLVLRSEFVKNHICPWIGDIRDAYIGQCDATTDETKYAPIALDFTGSSAADM